VKAALSLESISEPARFVPETSFLGLETGRNEGERCSVGTFRPSIVHCALRDRFAPYGSALRVARTSFRSRIERVLSRRGSFAPVNSARAGNAGTR